MNELVLLSIAIAASYVRPRDRMPALVFSLVCYMHYYSTNGVGEPAIYFVTALFDLAALKMITALNGAMRSKFNFMICCALVLSVVIQSFGFLLYHANWPISAYNNLAYTYYFGIIVLFLSRRGGDGNLDWHPRFLRDYPDNDKNSSKVSR